MKSPQLVRNILASAAVAAVLSIPHRATAADLQPLVITDIPHDSVAIRHSVPPYPRNAQTLRIGGDVRLILEVERGHIVSITAQRGPPMLAYHSVRWVRDNWQFKPSISGQYVLPISYVMSSRWGFG
jgi:Gram-negative bacterial TonB protein C-terminal